MGPQTTIRLATEAVILCFPSDKDKCMRKVFVCAQCTPAVSNSKQVKIFDPSIGILAHIVKQGDLEFFIISFGVMLINLLNVHVVPVWCVNIRKAFYSTKLNMPALACGVNVFVDTCLWVELPCQKPYLHFSPCVLNLFNAGRHILCHHLQNERVFVPV